MRLPVWTSPGGAQCTGREAASAARRIQSPKRMRKAQLVRKLELFKRLRAGQEVCTEIKLRITLCAVRISYLSYTQMCVCASTVITAAGPCCALRQARCTCRDRGRGRGSAQDAAGVTVLLSTHWSECDPVGCLLAALGGVQQCLKTNNFNAMCVIFSIPAAR